MIETTDYLVKGCGASALAFVDVMLRETDATFTIVDKRAAPGGHWNDAYPFVRLHQPSSCYGVASRTLGHDRKDTSGFNAGFYELASGFEVVDYFHQVMSDRFLESGRVSYHPMSELVGDTEIVSLLSGVRCKVEVRKKHVDATLLSTSVPLTHKRKFAVAQGVACVPPNDLTRLAPAFERYVVLGAGKTAIDSVSWLLANGARPEAISWVLPRDAWLYNRKLFQPGEDLFVQTMSAIAEQYEACAAAQSFRDLCERMEAVGNWLRLDPNVWPTMFHGATVTAVEVEHLRRIGTFIRKGRVQRIEQDRMVLDDGEVSHAPNTLFLDCTARALAGNVGSRTPVFAPGRIHLQMIRLFQPTFSAALIGHLEASVDDEETKRKLSAVTSMTDTVEHWAQAQVATLSNQAAWMSNEELRTWIRGCRLDLLFALMARVRSDDTEKQAVMSRVRAAAGPCAQNLARLLQTARAV